MAQPDPAHNSIRVAGVGGPVSKEEVEANARLIAAAPDMLAALIEIKRCNEQYNFGSKLLRVVLPAIAKATQAPDTRYEVNTLTPPRRRKG